MSPLAWPGYLSALQHLPLVMLSGLADIDVDVTSGSVTSMASLDESCFLCFWTNTGDPLLDFYFD